MGIRPVAKTYDGRRLSTKALAMIRTFTLPFEVRSPLVGRRLVEQFARDQGFDARSAELTLIVSELVANALIHGREPIELTLQAIEDEMTVEVADGGTRTDSMHPGTGTQITPGGRGLRIVAALADRWGTRASQTGKRVWATVRATNA